MPPIPPARQRVVEVIADLGIGQSPRWRYGSGLLIGGRRLLTSAHVVVDAVEVTMRRPDKSSLRAVLENALIGEPDARRLDMALLDVPGADDLPPVPLALVDRNVPIGARVEGCAAVGYPQWTEIRRDADGPAIRETAQVGGYIAPLSGLVEDLLSLEVTATPQPLPGAGTALAESEWSGMSGAAVFAPDPSGNGGEVLVGVVAEHSPRRGQQNITVLPLDRLTNRATGPPNAEEWWRRLDVADPMHLPKISGRNVRMEDRSAVRVPVPSEAAPVNYVDRPEITGPLLAYLLGSEPIPKGRAMISAVHGLGGIGKTTVARWLVWRPEIEQRFGEGRIWVTLGNEPPDAITKITDCVSQLDPTVKTKATEEAARADLAALLQDRSILFIIDDVWPGKSAEVAKALIVPSPYSRFLLTTRFPGLADDPEIQARDFPLDEMNAVQAAELITRALGHELSAAEQALAQRLCEMTGGHPLALELAAARIRKGRKWEILLDDLAAEIGRLDAFEETKAILIAEPSEIETRKKTRSVRASLLLSARYLYRAGQNWLERFAWLGILAEDAIITPRMAATLWSTGEETADVYLRELSGAGLLRATDDSYRIHDLMHDLALELLSTPTTPARPGDIPGFGLTLLGANRQFLECYRSKTDPDLWHTLPQDGYIHDHLVRHFEQAGWESEIESLLWEESADGHCGWYSARERLGQTAGFLADVGRVWSYADRVGVAATSKVQRAQAIALQLHCALIIASINSLSASIPPVLLVAAVRCGVMALPPALALVRQHPDPRSRVSSLLALSSEVQRAQQPSVLGEALSASRGIGNEYQRAEALAALAPHLSEPLLAEALELAGEFAEEKERAWLLGKLAAHLPEPLQRKSLAIARSIGNEYQRAEALAALAPHLSEPLLAEALELAGEFAEEKERAWLLGRLAAHLPEPLQRKSLAIARSIGNEYQRAEALAALAPHLSEPLLAQALELARDFADEGERAWTLGAVGRHFSGTERTSVLAEALAVARAIKDERRRAWALRELVPHLPGALLNDALDVAQKIQGAAERASVLSSLAPHLQPAVREEALTWALAAARTIGDASARATALRTLAPHLPEALEAGAWAQVLAVTWALAAAPTIGDASALAAARTIGDASARATALRMLEEAQAILEPFVAAWGERQTLHANADLQKPVDYSEILSRMSSHLPGPLLVQAFDAIRQKEQLGAWEKLLPVLGPHLPESALRKALTDAFRSSSEPAPVRTLVALAPYLPGPLLTEALDASRRLESADERTAALVALVPHLATPLREEVIVEALNAAPGMQYQGKWKGVLSALAPHLHGPLLRQALAVARGIKKADLQSGVAFDYIIPWDATTWQGRERELDERADGLAALAPYLPEPLLAEAVAAARALEDGNQRAKALAALTPHLPRPLLAEALAAARSIGDVGYRAWVLMELERQLPRSVRSKELDAARAFLDEHRGPYIYIMEELSSYNPAPQFAEALHRVERIRNSGERTRAWTELAPRLPAQIWSSFWRKALAGARSNRDSGKRIQVLAKLSVYLPDPHGSKVWSEAMQAVGKIRNESERTKTLAVLHRCEPGRLLAEELIAARQNEDGFAKVSALAKIAPRLPESQRVEILTEALAATCTIEDPGKRSGAMIELSPGLTGPSLSVLYDLWRQKLPVLARRSRADLLIDLWASQVFLLELGGSEIITGIFRGVHAVGQWWP